MADTKQFIVEVPCTTRDLYYIFAESEEQAKQKIDSGFMSERTEHQLGDYEYMGPSPVEAETHWEEAEFIKQA